MEGGEKWGQDIIDCARGGGGEEGGRGAEILSIPSKIVGLEASEQRREKEQRRQREKKKHKRMGREKGGQKKWGEDVFLELRCPGKVRGKEHR